jgi:hypothetical protein
MNEPETSRPNASDRQQSVGRTTAGPPLGVTEYPQHFAVFFVQMF